MTNNPLSSRIVMKLTYEMIDEIIADIFGEPDPATGVFSLDHGNLQAFAARVLEAALENNVSKAFLLKE